MAIRKKAAALGFCFCAGGFLFGFLFRGFISSHEAAQQLSVLEPKTTQAQTAVHFPTETLFSPDPELSQPFLEVCLSEKDGDRILLAWILGSNSEIRTSALKYYLSMETEFSSTYEGIIDDIVRTSAQRKMEIRELARSLGKDRLQVR